MSRFHHRSPLRVDFVSARQATAVFDRPRQGEDILLLRAVGLCPVVVHGGGPDISKALAQLGGMPQFIEGMRVTPASDLKVVERVLTGSINTEIVTLLNRKGANAVGLSGKDGALLRAKKLVRDDGRDLGQVGDLEQVNAGLIDRAHADDRQWRDCWRNGHQGAIDPERARIRCARRAHPRRPLAP